MFFKYKFEQKETIFLQTVNKFGWTKNSRCIHLVFKTDIDSNPYFIDKDLDEVFEKIGKSKLSNLSHF